MIKREFLKLSLLILGILLIGSLKVFSAPLDFICKRCGRCCQELVMDIVWASGNLTQEQKRELIKERKKYPIYKQKGCQMLVWEDKLAVCLVHKLYGYKAKPKVCQEYPKDGVCLRMKK